VNAKVLLVSILIATLLAGCESVDPYTRETKTSNTATGAGIGAVAGGIAGALINKGDRGKGAVIGAALGAGVGAGIGNYMDQQEAELRRILEGSGVSVTRMGDRIVLNMPGNITFDTDKSDIKSSFYAVLDSVALVLKKFNQSAIQVSGHTDSTGSRQYNQELSLRRAQTVAYYLQRHGIDSGRMNVAGYGEDRPIADNSTPYGRSQNRRVEIEILPPRK
jgi:outer membrane protein OmpA-like peptidoglycan-associated protein